MPILNEIKEIKIIKGICFYCKTIQHLKLKPMNDQQMHYVCPNCNASNSNFRLTKDIAEGKAWEIK